MNKKDKDLLSLYLKSQNLMTLATGGKAPWVATVYYTFDKEFNLYFVSSPRSKHCQDIEKNNNVACSIYNSHIKNSEKKTGLQLQGTASKVEGWDRSKFLLKMWHKAAPGMEEIVNVKNMMNKVISSRVYKITPTYIKFFNEPEFGEEKYK